MLEPVSQKIEALSPLGRHTSPVERGLASAGLSGAPSIDGRGDALLDDDPVLRCSSEGLETSARSPRLSVGTHL